MSTKLSIEFEGFDEVIAKMTRLQGDVKDITEKALKASHEAVTPAIHTAMAPHHRSGDTERAIVDNAEVYWEGTKGVVDIGFNIRNGGLPSIFLMYGTPKMSKDQRLYNSIYGKSTRDKVKKIQEDIFYDELNRLRT